MVPRHSLPKTFCLGKPLGKHSKAPAGCDTNARKGLSVGKACVRFANPERMDFALIDKLLADSRDAPAAPC